MNRAQPTLGIALRSALYTALMVITVAPYAICVVLWSWLPMPRRYRMVLGWTRFAIEAARVILGVRWEVRGRENLPDEPAIILSKHQSVWETLWFTTFMPRPLCYVYKHEIHYMPLVGWAMMTLDMIHIDRSRGHDAFEQVAEQGARKLARGSWIVIFPEGTRTAPGAEPRYKTGGARLAVRTGAPIIPIALNSGEIWPRRKFLKYPGLVTVSIGPLIRVDGLTAEEVAQRVQGWIEGEMRRISPEVYGAQAGARAAASREQAA
jgi:1-acyl-sn-glycerol-3-phosphate acyltransferase